MFVYKITNLLNGKVYVGRTKRTLKKRFQEHSRTNSIIGRDMRKFGLENFEIELLEECKTYTELKEKEQLWIIALDCKFPKGYNVQGVDNSSEACLSEMLKQLPNKLMTKRKYESVFDFALNFISGKHKHRILYHLENHPLRFGELLRLIPQVTHQVLTRNLRELERDGIIHREVYPVVPPKTEYTLTDFGRTLTPILAEICNWGRTYMGDFIRK